MMTKMFESDYYIIRANADRQLYELVNKVSGFSEAEDIAYPKLLVTLKEFERVTAIADQEKNRAVVTLIPR